MLVHDVWLLDVPSAHSANYTFCTLHTAHSALSIETALRTKTRRCQGLGQGRRQEEDVPRTRTRTKTRRCQGQGQRQEDAKDKDKKMPRTKNSLQPEGELTLGVYVESITQKINVL